MRHNENRTKAAAMPAARRHSRRAARRAVAAAIAVAVAAAVAITAAATAGVPLQAAGMQQAASAGAPQAAAAVAAMPRFATVRQTAGAGCMRPLGYSSVPQGVPGAYTPAKTAQPAPQQQQQQQAPLQIQAPRLPSAADGMQPLSAPGAGGGASGTGGTGGTGGAGGSGGTSGAAVISPTPAPPATAYPVNPAGSANSSNSANLAGASEPGGATSPWQPAQADEDQLPDAARICAALGVLRGDGNGVDSAYLAKSVTRIQAIFITLRLLGKESAAMLSGPYPNFNDIFLITDPNSLSALAYVRANPQYGWQGDTSGMIDPLGYVTVQTMGKVLLSVLGYEVGEDFDWDGTVEFAALIGIRDPQAQRLHINNSEFAAMLVDALKTRMKGSEATLAEALAAAGLIDESAARGAAVLPGSIGYEPLLAYAEGGPLLIETRSFPESRSVSFKLNTDLNPAYAKATKNYRYLIPGAGYVPLPARCATKMLDESTVEILFPADGWAAIEEIVDKEAFAMYIATPQKSELLVSGLQDVDGNDLPDFYLDVPH